MKDLIFDYEWIPVFSAHEVNYSYPDKPTKFLSEHYKLPVVYRWVVTDHQRVKAVYYGEAESLNTRINGYRSGHEKQQTNARLKKYFTSLDSKLALRLEVLKIEPFTLHGVVVTQADFGKKHVRCFLENAFITMTPTDVELLNLSHSVDKKRVGKALKGLSPEQLKSVLAQLEIKVRAVSANNATQE